MKFEPMISHEFPLKWLEKSRDTVDYDYALVHHLKNKEYFDFFKESLELGRHVILDNSIFELGTAYHSKKYTVEINRLNPSEYMAPDVFNKFQENIDSQKNFISTYGNDIEAKPVVIIHGETIQELEEAYKFFADEYPSDVRIAIPFGSKAFEKIYEDAMVRRPSKEMQLYYSAEGLLYRKSRNRYWFLERMVLNQRIDLERKHHLLGSYTVSEMMCYRVSPTDFSFISSIDTSHPVAMTLEGRMYEHDYLYYKPAVTIESVFNDDFLKEFPKELYNNINRYRGAIKPT